MTGMHIVLDTGMSFGVVEKIKTYIFPRLITQLWVRFESREILICIIYLFGISSPLKRTGGLHVV